MKNKGLEFFRMECRFCTNNFLIIGSLYSSQWIYYLYVCTVFVSFFNLKILLLLFIIILQLLETTSFLKIYFKGKIFYYFYKFATQLVNHNTF